MPITLNGTGTIAGLSAGGLPDASVQQADLAGNVAGTGPAFSVYKSANQIIPSGTATKVTFDTELFDTANAFTNSRWTPGVAGIYTLHTTVLGVADVNSATVRILEIHVNGVAAFRVAQENDRTQGSIVGMSGSVIATLSATDFVEVFFLLIGANPQVLGQAAAPRYTQFSGALVRAA